MSFTLTLGDEILEEVTADLPLFTDPEFPISLTFTPAIAFLLPYLSDNEVPCASDLPPSFGDLPSTNQLIPLDHTEIEYRDEPEFTFPEVTIQSSSSPPYSISQLPRPFHTKPRTIRPAVPTPSLSDHSQPKKRYTPSHDIY
jgi:hypothetical protein